MIHLNGDPVDVTMFPDKTSQVWKLATKHLNPNRVAYIDWDFSHEGEFMQLAQLKELLDAYHIKSELYIKYLPYARQDKVISNESTFALTTFANLLNSLEFERVSIMDPHSDVAERLIDNCYPVYPLGAIHSFYEQTESDAVCFPDNGANIKYGPMLPQLDSLYGEKNRNQLTGWIEGYKLIGDPSGKRVLIVDDICDGGMTFTILTKELLEKGAKEVNLFVTHGIFSKGLSNLRESGIKRIFTADGEASEVQGHIAYKPRN